MIGTSQKSSAILLCSQSQREENPVTLIWVITQGMTENSLFCREKAEADSIGWSRFTASPKCKKKTSPGITVVAIYRGSYPESQQEMFSAELRISRALRDVNCDSR